MTREPRSAINLAREPAFLLGDLEVRPATLEVRAGPLHRALEPRIMQVLVALSQRTGEVVTRDDLTELCWAGRIVGDDSINRCINHLRRLADDLAGFSIKTVPRVGYRLDPHVATSGASHIDSKVLLAVLAFDNLSSDPELLYFSDGLSGEILHAVSRRTDLTVIGRSSSFSLRGGAKSARSVERELGATHLLDGSVRRNGDQVRVSVELVECAAQTALWSDQFDRDLSDIFALQDEIAAAVATALKAAFSPSLDVGPIDPVAYDLYLRARASSPGRLGAFDAEQLRQATARAPRFAQAWAALAITRATQAANAEGERLETARPEAFEAAHKALALDPKAGTAYVALALLEPYCGRFQEIETLYDQALAASPDDQVVLERFSRWLHGVGRSAEALAHITRAYQLDPLYHQGANWYAVMIGLKGRLDEAFEVWDRARARWPTFDVLTFNPMLFAVGVRDWKQVDKLFVHIENHGVDSDRVRDAVRRAHDARDGKPKSVEDLLHELSDQLRETGTVGLSKVLDAYPLGGRDAAFEIVERASFAHLFQPSGRLAHGDSGLHVLFNGNRSIHSDPRFVGLCAKLGLCDFWASTDRWPDCAARVTAAYDFKAEARRLAKRAT